MKIKLWLIEHSWICRKYWHWKVGRINKKLRERNAGYIYMPYIISDNKKKTITNIIIEDNGLIDFKDTLVSRDYYDYIPINEEK